MFETDVDVANRALQHCGLPRIDPALGFTEVSERAAETSFAYGKVKRASLRRNVYQFSTRSAALRPIDTNTLMVAPAMWEAGTTYFKGSLVSDQNNFFWQSKIPNNIGAQPGQPGYIYAWEPYFGPLTVSAYDSTQSYFAGELAYIAPGDGTYNVYLSLLSGNALDPSLRNVWSAQAVYFQNNVVIVYPAWAGGTTYAAGATVTYTDGNTYSSLVAGNVGNAPATSPAQWALTPILSLVSQQVPVVTAVQPPTASPVIEYASGTVYSLGSFTLFASKEYVSLQSNNTGNQPNLPGSSAYWAQLSGGTLYMSLFDLNANNNPANAPALWASGTSYSIGNTVGGSDGIIYTSLTNANLGNNPANGASPSNWSAGGLLPWTTVFTQGGGNQQWLQIGGASFPAGVALQTLDLVSWPIGSGPLSQTGSSNVFRLPAGWLREAPQDPKAGSMSALGAPSGLPYNDWEYRGNYFTSWTNGPIVYWFAADVVDVSTFDDMFCEMSAFEVAIAVAPTLAPDKLAQIKTDYEKYAGDTRTVNGVNLGAVEPSMDDYLSCRY
jgi:hypothetical protein